MSEIKTKRDFFNIKKLLKNICLTVFCSLPVFLSFVLTAQIGGFQVFNFLSQDVFPPLPVYLADFSLCFSSRLLIGSVTKLFSYKYTVEQIYCICGAVSLTAIACVSFIGGVLLKEGIKRKNFVVIFITVLFMLNPLISQTNYMIYGSFDTYWMILFVLTLSCYKSKLFYAVVPIVSFVAILVHVGYLVSYLPALMVLLIYDFFNETKKSEKIGTATAFSLTGLSSVGMVLYSLVFANSHLTMTSEEFHEYLYSRLSLFESEKAYYEKLVGGELFPVEFFEGYFFAKPLADSFDGTDIKTLVEGYIYYYIKDFNWNVFFAYMFAVIPFLLVFTAIWISCTKKVTKLKKIPYILFIGIQFCVIICLIISTDFWRWIAAGIITQCGILCILILKDDYALKKTLNSQLLKKPVVKTAMIVLGIVFVCYCFYLGRDLPTIQTVWEY